MSAPFSLPQSDLWTRLTETKRPIFLYGMGDGADKILAELSVRGIPVKGVFASDEFVRGHSFRGFPVRRYSQVFAEHPDMIALLCFAVDYEPMLSRLNEIDAQCELYAPDVPVVPTDGHVFDLSYAKEHEGKLSEVYGLLADEASRRVFGEVLSYKLTGKISHLRSCETPHEEAWELLGAGHARFYVDLGAYNGDTLSAFIEKTGGAYTHLTAFEPDVKNCEKLRRKAADSGWRDLSVINAAAWDCADTLYIKKGKRGRGSALIKEGGTPVLADTVDHILNGGNADFIKFDVEGAEARAIAGAKETILRCHPNMEIAAYHKNEDLFAIPRQVLSIRGDYDVFLRHHPYVPAWETNYYFKAR